MGYRRECGASRALLSSLYDMEGFFDFHSPKFIDIFFPYGKIGNVNL